MSDYVIHGKKGNGKSLVCVGRIRDALLAGKPVATNLDLKLEYLLPAGMRNVRCFRLPDRPSIDDLRAIGFGSDQVDESTYGLVVLDECATMLNARTFNDKGRKEFLDWFVHSRKLGWDTYFICQNPIQIDKQVRESLVELSVSCKRLDKLRIPFVGVITKNLLGVELRPPQVHIATVRYGTGHDAMVSDRWTYTGKTLYRGYDTRQVFREEYSEGLFSVLSPWHLSVVASPPGASFVGPVRPGPVDYVLSGERGIAKNRNPHMTKYLAAFLMLGVMIGAFGYKYYGVRNAPVVVASGAVASGAAAIAAPGEKKFSDTVTGKGFFLAGGVYTVLLSDGSSVVSPLVFNKFPSGWESEISPGVWVKGLNQ